MPWPIRDQIAWLTANTPRYPVAAWGGLFRAVLLDKVFHRVKQDRIEIVLGSPANKLAGFRHIRNAPVAVLISLAVKLLARYRDDLRVGIAGLTKIFIEGRAHLVGKLLNHHFILRRPDIEDLPVANVTAVVDDAHDAIHCVINVGVGTVVNSTIHQLDGRAVEKRIHKMAEDTRIAGLLARKVINARPNEIKGPDNRVVQSSFETIGVQNALEKLLCAGVDPTVTLHRPHDEGCIILGKRRGML